jgi:MFS family permease
MVFLGIMIPIAAALAERWSPRGMMIAGAVGIVGFGFALGPLLSSGTYAGVVAFSIIGFSLAGLSYGALGAALAELFPTAVRYTGISLTFNLAGILGASLTPYIATWFATNHGIASVGYYLAAVSAVSVIALLALRK